MFSRRTADFQVISVIAAALWRPAHDMNRRVFGKIF